MPKIVNCIVDTFSKKEREQLISYCNSREPFQFLLDNHDGFELFAIHDQRGGWVGVMVARCMVNSHHYKHFHSLNEFIKYHEDL